MATAKRIKSAREGIDPKKLYSLEEAVKLVKECATAKFDETIEVALNLGVDPRHCLLYTSPSPRDLWISRMPSSA